MLPVDFKTIMLESMSEAEYEKLASAIELTDPIVSIRLNKQKKTVTFDNARPVRWCPEGMYLEERPSFTLDPHFHAGAYYVQEASSMYISNIIRKYITSEKPIVALDLCAAPGGKSTLALTTLPEDSLLIANEPIHNRANILAENIIKWGNPNTIVTSAYADDFKFLGTVFDLIICDAPCSGEGMFRKDRNAISEWSIQNVKSCQQRQREILSDIWDTLKPGGMLIYSTCTFNHYEDEDNLQWMHEELNAEILDISETSEPQNTFHSYMDAGEGFFACAVRKHEDENAVSPKKTKQKGNKSIKIIKNNNKELNNQDAFTFYQQKDNIRAFPTKHFPLLESVMTNIPILHSGITIGTIKENGKKGNEVIPSQSLAMSTALNVNTFPQMQLSLNEALCYLHGDTLVPESETPRGYVLMNYEGSILGFGKNVGNRINNLYPSEWRIRKNIDKIN